jgi:hypothetical protein
MCHFQLATCVRKPETLQVYETFFDGAPITEVLLQIDPEPLQPVPSLSNLQGVNITFARIKIFHCIIRNIKNIYEVTQSPPKMHNKAEKFTERKTFGVVVAPSSSNEILGCEGVGKRQLLCIFPA